MIIAVNAVAPALNSAASPFFQAVFIKIAAENPAHQFVLVGFRNTQVPSNCILLHPDKKIQSPLGFLFWLRYQLPAILKKNNATVLITHNSCCLRTAIPQVLYLDDIAIFTNPAAYKKNWQRFYKKYLPRFLSKAAHTAEAALFIQETLTKQFAIPAGNISTIYAAATAEYVPAAHWNMKEATREQLSSGKEYFLYAGHIHPDNHLVSLLKAFSFFKQRQKSNMLLVLASADQADAAFVKSLSSYKYRAEVVLAENIPNSELAAITAAAYAVVYPVPQDTAGTAVLQAMQCAVPVITAGAGAMPEICGEAAAYCKADDFNDIAAKMMLLFTNEDRRNLLIAKGRDRVAAFSINESSRQLWQLLTQAAKA